MNETQPLPMGFHMTNYRKNRLLRRIVRYFHFTVGNRDDIQEDATPYEVQMCKIVAWTGALVVTVVVLRSLYLMYMKPDGY